MSLFGNTPSAGGGGGLFGSSTANKPSLFGSNTGTTGTQPSGGGLFGSTQNNQGATGGTGGGLFGSTPQNNQQGATGGGLFGSTTNQQSSAGGGGLFGSSTTQNQPSGGGLFGSSTTQNQQPSGGGLFGSTTTQNQPSGGGGGGGGGLFGSSTTQTQPSGGGLFGSTTQQKPASGLFGGGGLGGQQQQTGGGLFGGGQQQQQQQPQTGGGLFGTSTQQQPQQPVQQSMFGNTSLGGQPQQGQQPQLGQSTAQQPGSSLWSPGRAVTGVHRTVPMQMQIIKDKWESTNFSSPFRTYLYNNVGEDAAPFYQPGPEDDEAKWEEALRQRPSSGNVPVLVRGFWELGKRAQRQKDFLTMMQNRLHEINNCLSDLLSRHDLKISVKIADCRRKHIVLSKRCLALAAKTQVLRNRGYAMDDSEEELKKKLAQLERSVFDPTLNGRGEEIWARMLAIREHSKRLQVEMDRAGANAVTHSEDELDENTMKTVKKVWTLRTFNYWVETNYYTRSLTITTLRSITCRRN